ncbi:hypothetical protein GS485_00485 [Rhodococcus hoagii]|nr:hypothetical protein [Prescottella equi]NKR70317.1 hypothetical protein [Prescottella equi]NKT03556.1 hypothetical protein [Prescottella equi]
MSQVRILPRALRFIHQHLRGTAEDRHALLIRGGERDIGDGPAVVARSDGSDLEACDESVTGPDLRDDATAERPDVRVTETVGDGPAGHAHRQHAVREDTRMPAIARVYVVAVQWVEVAGRTRVHDDLCTRQILDQDDGPRAADREIICSRAWFDDRDGSGE